MSDYAVKRLEEHQFDTLIPLMEDCFGMNVKTEYFKWKYLDNPAGKFVGFAAVENTTGEIAAFYGVIPKKFIVDAEERILYQACDAMTHSRHRRKGLFQRLVAASHEYLGEINQMFAIAVSVGAQSQPGFAKLGWKEVFDFQYLFIPSLLCYTNYFKKSGDERCEPIEDLAQLENLIKKKPESYIYSARDSENLRWRYHNPLHCYQITGFREDGELKGYVCYYIEDQKLFLFDFEFNTKESQKYLIDLLKGLVIKEKLKGILAFAQKNSQVYKILRSSGFLTNPLKRGPLNETPPFMFYSDDETMRKFANADCWLIKSYDHDAI